MKNIKLLIIPDNGLTTFAFLRSVGVGYLLTVFGGLVVATIMGGMAVVRPPLLPWHAAVAAIGFAAVLLRMRLWERLGKFMDTPLPGQLMVVAVGCGLIVSVVALARPAANR
jgi:hypothetical protein